MEEIAMSELRFELLGGLRILLDGVPITDDLSQKSRALLCYLAVEGRALPRGSAAALLWGEFSEADAAANLRQALTQLRRVLGAALLVTRHSVALNQAPWVDALAFEWELSGAQHDPAALRAAIELYRGDFLAGVLLRDAPAFDEWAALQRERLRIAALRALDALLRHALAGGDYAAGMDYAHRVLALDPWREEAHRQLMWLLVRTGQRSAALAQYQQCRRVLRDELDVEPMAETTALWERIAAAQSARQPATPLPATPFVGRAHERAAIDRQLAVPGARLITITGPGGVGKTRLALHVAADWSARLLHGARVVSLAALGSPDLLPSAIMTALGVAPHAGREPLRDLCDHLADRDLLLVLDNFEHLAEGGADVLAELLRCTPDLKLLVTSRVRLRLHDEQLIELDGLTVPSSATTESGSAVELFVHSARKLRPDFALDDVDRRAVTRICQLVGGLPLGIELAAAWTRLLPCEEIAREIEASVGFLASSLRDLPQRHQSMRAVFEHSWRLLRPAECAALRRLAVFRGGCDREAAAEVAGASLHLLGALIDQSLLRVSSEVGGAPRYELHELIRQFALEQLEQAGALVDTHDRHLRFFLRMAETAEPQLLGEEQDRWLQRIRRDYDNLRAALGWALRDGSGTERAEPGARLASAMWRFWWISSEFAEGRRWLDAARSEPRVSAAVRAKILHGFGVLAHEQGAYAEARVAYDQSLGLRRELGDRRGVAAMLNSLGVIAFDEGQYGQARSLYEESLAIKRELGDRRGEANTTGNLGLVAAARGEHDAARALFSRSIELCRELGDRHGVATGLGNLGALALDRDDADDAARCFADALPGFRAIGDRDGVAECLEGFAVVALAHDEALRAVRLYGAAVALRDAVGAPMVAVERRRVDALRERARATLGDKTFAAALQAGRSLPLEAAIMEALATVPDE